MHRVDRAFSVRNMTASIPVHYTLKGDISISQLLSLSITAFQLRSTIITAYLSYTDGTNHTEVTLRRFRAVAL